MGKAMFKLVIGLVVGGGLWFTAKAMGFPPVFQWAFFSYAAVGTVVFLLLDIPSMKPQSGCGAALSVLLFFALLCVGYGAGASLLPQFDPEDEKGKTAKVLGSAKSGNVGSVESRRGDPASEGTRRKSKRAGSTDQGPGKRFGRQLHSQEEPLR